MTSRKGAVRVASAAAAIGMAATGLMSGAGSADAAPLPSLQKSKSVPGGKVSVRLFDQKVSIRQAVTNVPTSREVWLSGKVRVTTSGDIKGATVTPGYLVGCQLNFGASAEASGAITSVEDDQGEIPVPEIDPATGTVTGVKFEKIPLHKKTGPKAGFTLSPGVAGFQPVIKTVVNDNPVSSFSFTGARGGVTYSQERFAVDGCAGFAQARPIVNVRVTTDEFRGSITVYGRPFSIG